MGSRTMLLKVREVAIIAGFTIRQRKNAQAPPGEIPEAAPQQTLLRQHREYGISGNRPVTTDAGMPSRRAVALLGHRAAWRNRYIAVHLYLRAHSEQVGGRVPVRRGSTLEELT